MALISHRWLSTSSAAKKQHQPHPDDHQNTKLRHLQALARTHPEVKYWWIDFLCIPQESGADATMTAVFSLPHYVKSCGRFFVLVNPSHTNPRYHLGGEDGWENGGWCRLERLAACAPYQVAGGDRISTLALFSFGDDMHEEAIAAGRPSAFDPLHASFWDDNEQVDRRNERRCRLLEESLGRPATEEEWKAAGPEAYITEDCKDRARIANVRDLLFDMYAAG